MNHAPNFVELYAAYCKVYFPGKFVLVFEDCRFMHGATNKENDYYCALYSQFMTTEEIADWQIGGTYFRVFEKTEDLQVVTRILDGKHGEDVPWWTFHNGVCINEYS